MIYLTELLDDAATIMGMFEATECMARRGLELELGLDMMGVAVTPRLLGPRLLGPRGAGPRTGRGELGMTGRFDVKLDASGSPRAGGRWFLPGGGFW
ncbi:hypothetical protein G6O69_12605 [Pseudenhygromyxa sp. WMMC2535]|uniref:hypothetical protein n=1 Tax=Pseudenhygromyxa sp. WMMC2535 TaxID=2712867 RepID=UPI0015521331|nr:hypothetical protein [Pseudenhygromyxa sp. WMMC2535]NVB38674.1 hypothetical protein [Pseudenhygromyxa sp. WMMC2535]